MPRRAIRARCRGIFIGRVGRSPPRGEKAARSGHTRARAQGRLSIAEYSYWKALIGRASNIHHFPKALTELFRQVVYLLSTMPGWIDAPERRNSIPIPPLPPHPLVVVSSLLIMRSLRSQFPYLARTNETSRNITTRGRYNRNETKVKVGWQFFFFFLFWPKLFSTLNNDYRFREKLFRCQQLIIDERNLSRSLATVLDEGNSLSIANNFLSSFFFFFAVNDDYEFWEKLFCC